jgi:hypothetical protein
MNVQTQSMDPRIARIHYLDYKKKVVAHREARLAAAEKKIQEGGKTFRAGRTERSLIEKEDQILRDTYRAMSLGQRVLNLGSVLRTAGLNKKKLPVLAVGRADWKDVFLSYNQYHGQTFTFGKSRYCHKNSRTGRWEDGALSFEHATFGNELSNEAWRDSNNYSRLPAKAMVPSVPVWLRPEGHLSEYHILWEAEWEVAPPVDPLLLKHISGPMYSVITQWDLTPVERAVLEGRIT